MTPDDVARNKAEIAELIARYNCTIDHNDLQGWADCFAPDGIFDGMKGGVHDEGAQVDRRGESGQCVGSISLSSPRTTNGEIASWQGASG